MSSSEAARELDASQISGLSDDDLKWVLALAAKEYSRRQQEGDRFPVFDSDQGSVGLTATDAVIVASAVLDALSVEIFELGMWQTWGAPDGGN